MPRSTLDEIVEDIRARANADFAFVLTRRGRLITVDAPRDMPEPGRMRLVRAARPVIGTSQTTQVTLSRSDLVPYGGAAPVDIYIAVAREQAILCVVMSTWADKHPIIPAIIAGLGEIEPMLDRRPPGAAAPKARGSERVRPGTSRPPPRPSSVPPGKPRRRGAMSGLVGLMGGVATPSRSLEQAPLIQNVPTPLPAPPKDSMPDIDLGITSLGRESMDALEHELRGSIPEIQIGEGAALGRDSMAALDRELRSSMPDILVGEGRLGAASLAAIEAASRIPVSSSPDVRLELASMSRASAAELARMEAESAERDIWRPDPTTPPNPRLTNPWSEAAVDSQRTVEAQRRARAVQPPRVSLRLESLDESVMEAALVEELETHVAARLAAPPPPMPAQPKSTPPPLPARTKTTPPPLPARNKTTPPPLPPRPKTHAPIIEEAPTVEATYEEHRPPQSSYEVWADAVDEVTEVSSASKKSKRR